MRSHILASSETMKIEYFYSENRDPKGLVYVFTASMNRNLEGNHHGGEVFFRNGFDTIAMKISNDDWFQSVPSNVFEVIDSIVNKKKYKKKIACGSSMGGYASIAFSKLLDCDVVIVFSPQYSIEEEFDKRWESFANKINFKYRISFDSIKSDCKFFIFYDNKDPDDAQVKKLLEILPFDNIQLIKLPFTGHPTALYLSEIGLIKDLVIKIANENSVEGVDFFQNKRHSKTYFDYLSHNLLKRNHNKWSLSAIESAIQIDGKVAVFHRNKSTVLDRLDRVDEAIAAIRVANALDPSNAHLQYLLSCLLNKQSQS